MRPAYPAAWSIADVFSHIGSGAVIMHRRLDDTLASRETPDNFAPNVWDTWNSKTRVAQRDDALQADAGLAGRLQDVTPHQRDAFNMTTGPMTLDFDSFVGMRLNEHTLHTWDIEVTLDETATIPTQAAALVVDNLELVARYTAKPTGDTTTVAIATTHPPRRFTIDLTPDAVAFAPVAPGTSVDIDLAAEALIRLVYGRLDPEHTSEPIRHDPALVLLRRVFPGP